MQKRPVTRAAQGFYAKLLKYLNAQGIPYLVGGTFAFIEYTGIFRETKDLDLFCKPGDYPRLLHALADNGFRTEVTDERWLAKAFSRTRYVDVIFGAVNGVFTVDDSWFDVAPQSVVMGVPVKVVAPEEFIWSKAFRQQRYRSDVADVYHTILKQGSTMNWDRLLQRMDQQWEVLFGHLLTFRFIYPSDRMVIPKPLMKELSERLAHQLEMPSSKQPICRGQLFSSTEYEVDITEWGYKNVTF